MAGRIRAHDWTASPIGPPEGWLAELRSVVDLMLASPLVASVVVGPERALLYNDAAAPLYGDRHPDALGRPLPETWPEAWAEAGHHYDRVFEGEGVHVPAQPLDLERPGAGQVFEAYLTPVRGPDGAVIAAHMTGFEVGAKLRAEAALRESEERQALLLRLSDAMRPLADPVAIQETAVRTIGAHLDADRACYVELDETRRVATVTREYRKGDAVSLIGRHAYASYGATLERLRTGRAVVFTDVEVDEAVRATDLPAYRTLGLRAFLNTPLLKDGELVSAMCVTSATPRRWTSAEVALVEEVGERTWAAVERARAEAALRDSEERHRAELERAVAERTAELEASRDLLKGTIDSSTDMIQVFKAVRDRAGEIVDFRWTLNNRTSESRFGEILGQSLLERNPGVVEEGIFDAFKRVTETGTPEQAEHNYVHEQFDGWFYQSVVKLDDGVATTTKDITAWKAAQAELLRLQEEATQTKLDASERRFRSLVTASAASIYRTSPDWRLMHQLDGSEFLPVAAEPIEDWVDRHIPAEDRLMVAAAIEDAIRRRSTFELEHRVALADGGVGWVSSRAVPIFGPNGEITEWFGAVTDITARKGAEAALLESEERFRRFGEASSDVLWIRDAATLQWEYLTPAFETIYGISREEAFAGDSFRNWADLIVADDRERAVENIGRVRDGETVTFEYRIRRPVDGEVRWLRNNDFPMRDAAGRVTRIGGVGQDVTGLKAVEAAVAASETRLRTLMEGIPQLVWRSCDEGDWTWSSPQWRGFTGQTLEESMGRGWLRAIHPDDREATMRAWARALPHGMLDAEYRVRRASDGAYLWHHARSVPVRDPDGLIVEWLGTSTDVQELKELQERQAVLVAELQHRVRNMLTVVRSVFSRTAETGGDLEDVADHFRGRLDALARTQVIVTTSAERRVNLEDLVRDELLSVGAADGPNVRIDGPEVWLPHKQAESIGLAVHELTTNAIKYGALKVPGAELGIIWSVNLDDRDAQRLDFTWTERGVPAVPIRPARQGFGRELIEEALPYRLRAETELAFLGGGVRCRITVPLSDGEAGEPAKGLA